MSKHERTSALADAKVFLTTSEAKENKQKIIATYGQEAYEKLEAKFLRNCVRLDEHYERLAARRKLEHRIEQVWWLFWTATVVTNILFFRSNVLANVGLFALCLLLAKAIYTLWEVKTGRYPPPPTNLERYDD